MTRKHLPRVIMRTPVDLRATASASAETEEEAPIPQSGSRFEAVGPKPVPTIAVLPAASKPRAATVSIYNDPLAARRRSHARKIVERHKMYAAMGGLFPVPIVSVAGVTAIIMRMVKALSRLYEVPFERDRTRSMVVGLMGGAVPTGLAAATSSTLAFVVPGSGLFGLAVSSVTAASFTRGIGLVFVECFENGATARGSAET